MSDLFAYRLEIYEEGASADPAISLYSDKPYLAIARGDLVNAGTFDHWGGSREQDGKWMLEVTRVEHIILKDGNHSLSVYTKYVPNTPATRGAR